MSASPSSLKSWMTRLVCILVYLAINHCRPLSTEHKKFNSNNASESNMNQIKQIATTLEPVYFGSYDDNLGQLDKSLFIGRDYDLSAGPPDFRENSFYSLTDPRVPINPTTTPVNYKQQHPPMYPYPQNGLTQLKQQKNHLNIDIQRPQYQQPLIQQQNNQLQSPNDDQLPRQIQQAYKTQQTQQVQQQQLVVPPQAFKPQAIHNQNQFGQIFPVQYPRKLEKSNRRKNVKLKAIYRPSVLSRPRPKPKPNLNYMLQPGQGLMSTISPSGNQNMSPVSLREIEDLLARLKPLAQVNKSDLDETAKEAQQLEQDDDDDNDTTIDKEDLEDLKRERRIHRVLPTSHLFGGSLGIVDENKLDDEQPPTGKKKQTVTTQVQQSSAVPEAASDEDGFMKTLAELGQKLSTKTKDEPYEDNFYKNQNKREPQAESIQQQSGLASPIPIEVLVDHLMSSSRLATFGVQHRDVDPDSYEDSDEPGLSEEEDDDGDQDNNGTLPADANQMVVEESTLSETIVSPSISFSSVLNRTDSWIPLDSIAHDHKVSGTTRKSSRKEKRKRKRATKGNELNLVIGGKVLNRSELVRLMRVLNKMASQKEANKEREASRKLLKFLVKLAMEQYLKNKLSQSQRETKGRTSKTQQPVKGKSQDDRVRDFLRSILIGPVGNGTSSKIELEPTAEPDPEEQQVMDEVEQAGESADTDNQKQDEATKKPKAPSLTKISDELEQYFDGDFFEDLADKVKNSSTSETEQKSYRVPKFSYQLPVPIYGHRYVEAADEDDVDMDLVRPPPRKNHRNVRRSKPPGRAPRRKARTRRRQRDEESEVDESQKRPKRNRSARKRERPDKNETEGGVEDPDEEPDKDESDRDDSDVKEGGTRNGIRNGKKKKRPSEADSNGETSGRAGPQQDGDQSDEEPSQPERVDESTEMKDQENPEIVDQPVSQSDDEARPNRRRRPKTKHLSSDKHYMRDEIPAPIVKGRLTTSAPLPKRESEEKTSKKVQQSKNLPSKSARASSKPKSRKRRTKQSAASSDRDRSTRPRQTQGRPQRDEPDVDSDMVGDRSSPSEGDDDYYNEGTTFSQICDDDGKCKTVVKSSSPLLNKAIETQDKKAIEKQLTKWASEPD